MVNFTDAEQEERIELYSQATGKNLFESTREIVARKANVKPEVLRGKCDIVFKEHDNRIIACIDEHFRIFFPQDFTPIVGQKYSCYYVQTLTGIFVYRGERHRVCRVYLAEEAKTVEDYLNRPSTKEVSNSPFAVLKGLKIPETYKVTAKKSPKGDVITLPPLYKKSDSDFDKTDTMYFLNLQTNVNLKEGVEYKVKVESKKSTHRTNNKGALMVNVTVTII